MFNKKMKKMLKIEIISNGTEIPITFRDFSVASNFISSMRFSA